MNENVASIAGFTTAMWSLYTELMGSQYGAAAPPSGSTPSASPAPLIESMSTMLFRSWTYGRTKSSWRVLDALMAVATGTRFTPALPPRSNSLARSCTQWVTSVSAGPPFGGLYLKPPSSGGLCEGVTTMPSASRDLRPRLCRRMAHEMTGVGVEGAV